MYQVPVYEEKTNWVGIFFGILLLGICAGVGYYFYKKNQDDKKGMEEWKNLSQEEKNKKKKEIEDRIVNNVIIYIIEKKQREGNSFSDKQLSASEIISLRNMYNTPENKEKIKNESDIPNELNLALETMSPDKAEKEVLDKIKKNIEKGTTIEGSN